MLEIRILIVSVFRFGGFRSNVSSYFSKAKIRLQSFFMLITTQLCFLALLEVLSEGVPTLVLGKAYRGTVGVLAFRSWCRTIMARLRPVTSLGVFEHLSVTGGLPTAA
jgi:hypothetical protein